MKNLAIVPVIVLSLLTCSNVIRAKTTSGLQYDCLDEITLDNANHLELLKSVAIPDARINDIAFNDSDTLLAIANARSINLLNFETLEIERTVEAHDTGVIHLTFLPNTIKTQICFGLLITEFSLNT